MFLPPILPALPLGQDKFERRYSTQKIKRGSQDYLERKYAWELVNTPLWRDWLKPLLEKRTNPDRRGINTLDDAFAIAQDHAVLLYNQNLLHKIERLSREFTQLAIDPKS